MDVLAKAYDAQLEYLRALAARLADPSLPGGVGAAPAVPPVLVAVDGAAAGPAAETGSESVAAAGPGAAAAEGAMPSGDAVGGGKGKEAEAAAAGGGGKGKGKPAAGTDAKGGKDGGKGGGKDGGKGKGKGKGGVPPPPGKGECFCRF